MRRTRFLFLAILTTAITLASYAETEVFLESLEGKITLAPHETRTYSFEAEAGSYVWFLLGPTNLKISLALIDNERAETVKKINRFPRKTFPEIFWPIEKPGSYTLAIRNLAGQPVNYQVRAKERRPVEAIDRIEIPAYYAYNQGQILREDGEYAAAIELYQSSLAVWLKTSRADWAASTLDNIGMCFRQLEDFQKAIHHYEEALEWWAKAPDDQTVGHTKTLINASSALWHLQRHEQAEAKAREALALLASREEDDGDLKSKVLNQLGLSLKDQGRLDEAQKSFERSLEFRPEADGKGRAGVYNNLSTVLSELGDLDAADRALARAQDLLADRSPSRLKASVLSNLAVNRRVRGSFFEAREFYNQALEIAKHVPGEEDEAEILRNLGVLHLHLGDYPTAEDQLEKAWEIKHRLEKHADAAHLLGLLGWTFADQEKFQAAKAKFQQARDLLALLENPSLLASILEKEGEMLIQIGEYADAKARLNEALELTSKQNKADHTQQGRLHTLFGELQRQTGAFQAARISVEHALKLSREGEDLKTQATALLVLAKLDHQQNQLDRARNRVAEALDLIDRVRSEAGDPQARATFLATRATAYDLAVELAMEAKDTAGAFLFNERSRSRSLLDLMASDQALSSLPEALRAEHQRLQESLNQQENLRLSVATQRPKPTEQLSQIEAQLVELTQKLRTVLGRIEKQKRSSQSPLLTLEATQRDLLDGDTLLLAYRLGEKTSYLWAITNEKVRVDTLPSREHIETLAERWHELRSFPSRKRDQEQLEAARELSDLLLKPVAPMLESKRLAILADGALLGFPFAVLPRPGQRSNQPLIAEHQVVNVPSASVLAALRQIQKRRQPAKKDLAIVFDPVFGFDDDRLASVKRPQTPRGWSLDRLGQSSREARDIARLSKGNKLLISGFDATRAFMTSDALEDFQRVHLITHGLANMKMAELSGLMFSTFDRRGKPLDGFFSVSDIASTPLRADLVTLSACETALGTSIHGEGLASVGRGFLAAGVPQVVATLWNVDDQTTATFMHLFYQGLLQHNLPAPEALRRAQLTMWKAPGNIKRKRPASWSPFILIGDWR